MIDFLVWLIISSLWIWGFNFCFREKQIFGAVGKFLDDTLSNWICKPLFKCPMCMSSVHGTILFLLLCSTYHKPYHVDYHIFFMVALCGLNDIIDGLTADYE